ncbi:MAG: Stp1/IreP family PP2C-type Ser/Thr phosphatase [Eubacteriales bacterium]
MRAYSIYETGCVRKNNEDSFALLPERGLFAVADGMGGHNAGEVASKIAIERLVNCASQLDTIVVGDMENWMRKAIEEANEEVVEESLRNLATKGMGTTLTAILITKNKVVVGHVGDSRIYLWRENMLSQISEDHSMVNELLRLGQISEEGAKNHPHKHVLSRALGVEKVVKIDCFQLEVQAGDVFVLCTDGFSNVINDDEMIDEFSQPRSWDIHLEKLKKSVLERGAPDNFTVVCCEMER